MADERVKVVSIMDYPPDPRFRRMCFAFLDSVIARGAASVTLLYENHPPAVAADHRRLADIEVVHGRSFDVGHPNFNLRFKLPNLAALKYPFLFLDADTYVFGDLIELWGHRNDKPWIGVNHQWVPADPGTHRPPFLNSGLQLVSAPDFYDLRAILAVQEAVAPLSRAAEFTKDEMFACPGSDQAVLFRYFNAIGYDYTHPAVGFEWNSCAGATRVWREDRQWRARTTGLADEYDVKLMHYWKPFKPWAIWCPVYESYAAHS